jgi:signal transduction histidine kinase
VRDTSVGSDPRHLPHIFDRFYRVDTARSDAGSGLGLAIARQIVEQHGGAIDVESQPGVGTTFTVSLADHPPGVA